MDNPSALSGESYNYIDLGSKSPSGHYLGGWIRRGTTLDEVVTNIDLFKVIACLFTIFFSD
jgi:hypothetical protein